MRVLSLTTQAAGAAIAAFVLAFLLASALPLAVGDRTFVVRSGSMAPAVDTGDVVVVEPIAPTEASIGDIVTFDDHGKLTQHRARAIRRNGDHLEFTTQGDANTGREHWQVDADGRIGRVTYRIPKLGFAVVRMQSTPGRLGLILVPALLLTGMLLRRIWRSEPGEEQLHGLAH
jgi:signal peptidase